MKQITVEKNENRAKDIIAARSKIYLLVTNQSVS